jgi:hypothetical protein
MYPEHSIPMIGALVNLYLTDIRFKRDHWKMFVMIGIFYYFVNFWGTIIKGRPLYPFLTWVNPLLTMGVCAILSFVNTLLFLLIVKIANKFKDKNGSNTN